MPTVVAICAVSDVVLIAAGVTGASAVVASGHWFLSGARAIGAVLLFAYGALAARRAWRFAAVPPGRGSNVSSWARVAGACLAFTWLNPIVYLDTVVLLGSIASTRPGYQWWFGGGAAVASILWFTGLGFGARLLARALKRPWTWQIMDGVVAVVMTSTALRVLLGG